MCLIENCNNKQTLKGLCDKHYASKYYKDNCKKIKEKSKQYYYNNWEKRKEKINLYYLNHYQNIQLYQQKYRLSHKDNRIYRKPYNGKTYNEQKKELRHQQGISKNYRVKYNGRSKTKEYRRLYRKRYKYLKKNAGELLIKTIQIIYEDNIKQYGTLTCYLCLQPILFGNDHLEHKIPLSRGGTNEYNNLAVACQKCNNKKHNKTEKEYRKELNQYGKHL